ncbi:MAG: ATP-binding protein [Sulfurovaceae bacterium]|nr:ATP-binding protein [Sulfurovaceae bacterium]
MNIEIVNPNISNFIKSLRDVGYTFEIAVADVLDNSISANASEIKIHTVPQPEIIFYMLDNGDGMSESELTEAMRLATKNPQDKRDKKDLGRFGLGLKTASFSQCKKLTVLSVKDKVFSAKQWDLEHISNENEWQLITPSIDDLKDLPMVNELLLKDHGTLVIWQDIDRYKQKDFSEKIDKLRKHLSLVFHRFLEGSDTFHKLKISINENPLKAFNPFNANHIAAVEKTSEKIKIHDSVIKITPYILPHHSRISQQEWDEYATEDGYIKSQGFYLYRANRLLIHGTWWGLHKATDAHKLVRIRIDISNDQDNYWGIDIKKSTANPIPELKKDLKRIIAEVTKEGAKPFTARGRKIKDKTTTKFWQTVPVNDELRFGLNKEHPIYQQLVNSLSKDSLYLLNIYLKGIEAYLPLESIQAHLQQNPHEIKQKEALTEDDIKELVLKLKSSGLNDEYIESLLKTEMFQNYKELLADEQLSKN